MAVRLMNRLNLSLDPVKPQPTQKEFLKAFYGDSEFLYLRYFDERKISGKAEKIRIRLEDYNKKSIDLKRNNEMGKGVFFVVNGGGQTDKEVIASGSCQAQFMEIDDYPQEVQIRIINAFPLKPSIIVKTRKSLHTYWLLSEDAEISRFRSIQKKLIDLFQADEVIQNESRVMRLPGFYHNKEDPFMVEVIEFDPGLKYSQDQIEAAADGLSFDALLENADLFDTQKNEVLSVCAEKKTSKKTTTNIQSDGSKFENGNRHNLLISQIGRMKNFGLDDSLIKGAILQMNKERFIEPLDEDDLERTIFPALDRWEQNAVPGVEVVDPLLLDKIKKMHPEMNKYFKWDDKGNGALFAEVFKDVIRWDATAKNWCFYDGKKWNVDKDSMMAHRCAKQLTDTLLVYALSIMDENLKNSYLKHITKLGQRRFRTTMIEDARDSYYMTREDFDKDIYSLNLQNGVLDLKNFELQKHNSNMLLTKICNASYDPEVRADRWIQFINEVMQGDQDKIRYLQKILGYSLTGDTKEETCYILYGQTTRNGKSTLVETISYMLGGDSGYSMNLRPESLAIKRNVDSRNASSDIARLNNCRFLNASEPPKRMLLDVGLLKTMLGRDTITARFLNQNEFQFVPCYKLFINTNFLPLVTDDSLFSSGRINVITFDRHFSEKEQDKNLKDELKEPKSLSGILNWCLEGLKLYYEEGADPPECVREATREYRSESDKIGCFIDECLLKVDRSVLSGQEVYQAYERWCELNGLSSESSRNFYSDLRAKNIMSKSGTINGKTIRNVVKGYTLITDSGTFAKDNKGELVSFKKHCN